MNQAPVMKLPCIKVLRLSQKPLDRRKTKNMSTKLMSHPQEMSCCQKILKIAKFLNLINVNEHETSVGKTDNNYWPPSTGAIVGDSIVNDIDEK